MKSVDRVVRLLALFFRGRGITYETIQREFGVTHRTAQRYMSDVQKISGLRVHESALENGQKIFSLGRTDWLRTLRTRPPEKEEMAALEHAVELLGQQGADDYRASLEALRAKLETAIEPEEAERVGADVEALSAARGFVREPGPTREVKTGVLDALRDANLRLVQVRFAYTNQRGETHARTVSPYGILSGRTPKLIAKKRGVGHLLQYRLDRISNLQVLDKPIPANADQVSDRFRQYVEDLFGSYSEKPVEVEWRFRPDAPNPEEWTFHPTQKTKKLADGTTVVRFRAGGLEDMARHVIGWWDWIEVVKPKTLRRTIVQMKLAGLAPLVEEFTDRAQARRIRALTSRFPPRGET